RADSRRESSPLPAGGAATAGEATAEAGIRNAPAAAGGRLGGPGIRAVPRGQQVVGNPVRVHVTGAPVAVGEGGALVAVSLAVQVLHVAGGQLQRVRLVADDAGQPVHEVRGLQVSHQLLDLRLDILKLADRLPVAHLEQGSGEVLLDGAQLSLALDLIAVFQLEHQV